MTFALFVALVANVVVGIVLIRKIRNRFGELGEELEFAEGVSFEVVSEDGVRIDGITMGEGPPIVLCHGLTETRIIWVPMAMRLIVGGFHVVAYDLRGHGQSASGESPPTLRSLADDLKAVLEHLDLRDATVVGHSMGGMAAQAFAIEHPKVVTERVRALVLTATGAAKVAGLPVSRASRIVYGNRLFEWLLNSRVGLLLVRPTAGKSIHPVHLAASRDSFTAMPRADRLAWLKVIQKMDLRKGLATIDVPTTVVVGGRDLMTPPFLSRLIVKHLPGAQLIKVPGAGHQLTYERPDLMTQIVVDAAEAGGRGAPVRRRDLTDDGLATATSGPDRDLVVSDDLSADLQELDAVTS